MDHRRYASWVLASHAVGSVEPFMTVALQGLGRLDAQIIDKDRARLIARNGEHPSGLLNEPVELSERLTLSYLWVLGAYEVVRALDQRFRESTNVEARVHSDSCELRRKFERVRMPLAKFEAAKRHKDTDSHVAFPALNERHGIAWQVAEGEFIARAELSDLLLAFLERLRVTRGA
jgi:hypothetical protein